MYKKLKKLYITSASCIVNAYPLYKSSYLRKKNSSFLIKMFL